MNVAVAEQQTKSSDNTKTSNDYYTVEDFAHLVNSTHYDNDDNAVFFCERVVEEEFPGVGSQIVVYRRKFNRKTRKFDEVDDTAVYARDVLEYCKREDNIVKMQSIMKSDGKWFLVVNVYDEI